MSVHIFGEPGHFAIWTDCQPGDHMTGRCVGIGDTVWAAVEDARRELQADVDALDCLSARDVVEADEQ